MRPRLIRRIVAMNVMITIEYRAAFLILMIDVIASPMISLLVWLTVSEQGISTQNLRALRGTKRIGLNLRGACLSPAAHGFQPACGTIFAHYEQSLISNL
jgi:hypothetical protein